MRCKGIVIDDFVNYKYPSMFLSVGTCDFKCARDGNFDKSVCQNSSLAQAEEIEYDNEKLIDWFISNPITKAVVIGGMEPLTRIDEVVEFISDFRAKSQADIVIYTGYYPYEILEDIRLLAGFGNIIFKFGRYIPDREKRLDPVLGVELSSDNQYGAVLNDENAQMIIDALQDTEGYCPCVLIVDDSVLCACESYRTTGECHCGLWK